MPYRTHFDPEHDLIEVTYFGSLTPADLERAAHEILEQLAQRGFKRVLADCSSIEGGHSVFDLYALADWLSTHASHLKEAVVVPVQGLAADKVEFWETTCQNRGLLVRLFHERQEALAWLCG